MMKKLMTAAVGLIAIASTPAMAATAGTTQTYTFNGKVDALCSISGADAVDFGKLTDTSGTYQNPGAKTATDAGANCNQAGTTATITHTDLFTSNPATAGFTNIVPLSASLSTNQGVTIADATSASGSTSSTGTTAAIKAFTALTVTATPGTPSARLVAGDYSGTVTVTLSPSA